MIGKGFPEAGSAGVASEDTPADSVRLVDGLFGWYLIRPGRGRLQYRRTPNSKFHSTFGQMLAEGLFARETGRLPDAGLPAPAAASPRLVIRGETSRNDTDDEKHTIDGIVLSSSGKPVFVPRRVPAGGEVCIVDWCSVTFPNQFDLDELQFEENARLWFPKITGFEIEAKSKNGMNGYRHSWRGAEGCGRVMSGGNNSTAMLMLDGHACGVARRGWESRLVEFGKRSQLVDCGALGIQKNESQLLRITRIDVAFDDFNGELGGVERFVTDFDNGLFKFSAGGRPSKLEQRGDWKNYPESGRSIYIGSRAGGKLLRIYEKGRQLGDPDSKWLRVELEIHGSNYQISADDLLRPSRLLAGSYPALHFISELITDELRRLTAVEKSAELQLKDSFNYLRLQYGRHLTAFREIFGDDKVLLDSLCREGWPDRLEKVGQLSESARRLRSTFGLPDF
ncbi:replication initiation factor domain-containing protein [Uliginosibacterium sp. H3]|uniref:Replication initiation factor domain-containing protein n=1 Tax=Uliginosibacterium silvisoli TaxID=3114758 RepID=A0ABU6K495_9RHOO|nr:replication initiation factor domain-containing protein [Uliginosibacterium sp. H3]